MADPKVLWQYAQMVADSTPEFYIEHMKRLREHGVQPYFALAHVHQLEIVGRLIRGGLYMGLVNGFFSLVGGGVAGATPFDWMKLIRRTPHGSVFTYQTMMRHRWPLASLCMALGQQTRADLGENLWGARKGERLTSVQMIERHVCVARELTTGDDARRIMTIGTWYDTVEEA